MAGRARRVPRVFLGTQEISGLYRNLELGLGELGVNARLVITHPHPFAYEQGTPNPWPARLAAASVLKHRRAAGVRRTLAGVGYVVGSLLLLLWSLPRFDAFIFGWGISILPRNLDLPVLRFFHKRVVVVMGHGSEARPPYMSSPEEPVPLSREALGRLASATATVAETVARIERWSTTVVGLPTTAQFFSRPFVDFYRLGVATALVEDVTPPPAKIVVLHVPSNPKVKGTSFIRTCMDAVIEAHPEVEYREISGRPHDEILAAIAGCTFVVDQLWSDIPMAAVGAEAAAAGRATVISGYAWDEWRRLRDPEDLPPAFLATPTTLRETIERCVSDLQLVRDRAEETRTFVRARWNPRQVAANYLRVLRGDVPPDWVIDPSDVRYAWGCGVSQEDVGRMVEQLSAEYGVRSLRWRAASSVYDLSTDRATP